ncbi:MAG: hypothetical protein ACRD0R_17375 [Acidimicrobiales bacterium]
MLRPGGWFVFVIGHPCFLAPDAAPTTTAAGIDAVDEPPAGPSLARQRPLYAEVPIFFAARVRRVEG